MTKNRLNNNDQKASLLFIEEEVEHLNKRTLIENLLLQHLVFIIFLYELVTILNIERVPFWFYGMAIVLSSLYTLIHYKKATLIIYSSSLVLFLIIYFDHIKAGLLMIINSVYVMLGKYSGIILPLYSITLEEDQHTFAYYSVLVFISALIILISYYIVRMRAVLLFWIVSFLLYFIQILFHIDTLLFANITLLIVGMYLLMKANLVRTSTIQQEHMNRSLIVPLLVIMIPLFVFLIIVQPIDNYEKGKYTSALQNKLEDYIEQLRYGKDRSNNFTEGDFTKLTRLDLSEEEVALEVEMEAPTSQYLRGFVGAHYTHKEWTPLDHEVSYPYYDLFYWLKETQFHPLNQLSIVTNVTEQKELLKETNVNINHKNASRKYMYTPYELKTEPQMISNRRSFNQDTLQSGKLFGQASYQFTSSQHLVPNYPTLATSLYNMADDVENISYLEIENHYNDFVYEIYTEIPQEIEMLYDHLLQLNTKTDHTHIPYETAINYTRNFLHKHISYNLNPTPFNGANDFIIHVLEDTKEGYATHFATVATTMFRYFNIPSRYVEGYLVTPKDIQDVSSNETIELKGANAHAWTEIYIDQIGWIPIEVTPPYFDMMDPLNTEEYPAGDQTDEDVLETDEQHLDPATGLEQVESEEEMDVIRPNEQQEEFLFEWKIVLFVIIFIILLLLLLFALYRLFTKRKRLKYLQQLFVQEDRKAAIKQLYFYMLLLLKHNGLEEQGGSVYSYIDEIQSSYSDELATNFKRVISIYQTAAYSTLPIDEEDYLFIQSIKDDIIEEIQKDSTFFQRLKLKYIDGVM